MKKANKNKTFLSEIGQNIKNLDKFLLLLIVIFAGFGLVVVFSSSNITAVLSYHKEPTFFFKKHLIFTAVGIAGMLFTALCVHKKYYKLLAGALFVFLIIMFILKKSASSINDANSWATFNGQSFQPSEFAKSFVILFMALIYGGNRYYKKWWYAFIPLSVCLLLMILIAKEPDFGTAGVIGFIVMLTFLALPIKSPIIKILRISAVLIGIAGIVGIYVLQPEFISRENTTRQESRFAFTEPCSRSLAKTGYQVCNAYIAINNGGLWGRGFGQSTQKFLYLPEAFTDFVFPIVIEEIGLVGSSIVLIAYIVLLTKILIIARHATNLMDSIIAFGTFSYILVHIIINLGGVLALIPMTGIPLPFLSYGGSFILNLFFLLGLTLRVSANNKRFA